jgi:hypothetical protein
VKFTPGLNQKRDRGQGQDKGNTILSPSQVIFAPSNKNKRDKSQRIELEERKVIEQTVLLPKNTDPIYPAHDSLGNTSPDAGHKKIDFDAGEEQQIYENSQSIASPSRSLNTRGGRGRGTSNSSIARTNDMSIHRSNQRRHQPYLEQVQKKHEEQN